MENLFSDDEKIKIGYFTYEMMYDPAYEFRGEKAVVIKIYGTDGEMVSEETLNVEIIFESLSVMTISVADLNAEIEKLSLGTNADYDVFLVLNGMSKLVISSSDA